MASIKAIIANHRVKLEAAGFLGRTAPVKSFPQTPAMQPPPTNGQGSLLDHSKIVQPSPILILFDVTLPKIEHILREVGETQAEYIVSRLCEYGKAMIEEYGIDGSREHLGELFRDLSNQELKLREENGVDEIIELYKDIRYLRLSLRDKIHRLTIHGNGMISLEMSLSTNDSDLIYLQKVKNLLGLYLGGYIDAPSQITDAGLAYLAKLVSLQFLRLENAPITDAGLVHLRNLVNLRELALQGTEVSDDGSEHLRRLVNLERLYLARTKVTLQSCDGFKNLKREIPGLIIEMDGWNIA